MELFFLVVVVQLPVAVRVYGCVSVCMLCID